MIHAMPNVRRAGLLFMLLGFILALISIFMASYPFNFGIWYQSEPVVLALRISSGLAGIGLVLVAQTHAVARRALIHPFVLVPAALALWSALVSPWQELPLQSWFGSPEIGEGVLWYMDMALLIAAALVLIRYPLYRRILLVVAVVATLIVAISTWMYMNGIPNPVAPYYFADYMAFLGIGIGGAVATLWKAPLLPRALVAALFCVGIVVVSSNNAAIGMLMLTPLALLVYRYFPLSAGKKPWLALAGVMAAPLLITLLVSLFELADLSTGTSSLAGLANSVRSRHHLAHVVWEALGSQPLSWLTGLGWGSYADQLAIHLPVKWAILVDDPLSVSKLTTRDWWDAIHRVDFHSHNYVLEALLGGGIPALLLTLGVYAILPLGSRKRYAYLAFGMALSLAAVAATWFIFIGILPILALAVAGLARPVNGPKRLPPVVPLFFVALFSLLSLAAGIESARFVPYAFKFTPPMQAPLPADPTVGTCKEIYEDHGRGGIHLGHRLRTLVKVVQSTVQQQQQPSPEMLSYLRGLACASEHYLSHDAGMKLRIATILSQSDLAFLAADGATAELVARYLRTWEQRVFEVLDRAPDRTDLAAPYLSYLLSRGDNDRLRDLTSRLYAHNPDDPIALWFSGLALLNSSDQGEAGIARMQRALNLGLERLMPVDETIKAQLTGVPAPAPANAMFRKGRLEIETATGPASFQVEIAETPSSREQGLQWRTSLAADHGMLLVSEEAKRWQVWMKDTFIPLDLLFLSVEGRVTEIIPDTLPRSTQVMEPQTDAIAVLELNGGTAQRLGIRVGAAIKLHPAQ
ncbi:hypothetical protein JCM17960_10590 [Magnetospira thiophila]